MVGFGAAATVREWVELASTARSYSNLFPGTAGQRPGREPAHSGAHPGSTAPVRSATTRRVNLNGELHAWRTRVRRIVERGSRGVVLRRRLRTPAGKRVLWVTPEASLRYWLPSGLAADVSLLRVLGRCVRPGARIWDLGANVGVGAFYAAACAGRDGRVLAVEPDAWLCGLMARSRNARPAEDAPVQVLTAAVSDRVGLAEFAIADRSRASNYLVESGGATTAGGARTVQHSITVTCDWLLERTFVPSLVKLDVEGSEARALRGAVRLLSEARPVLYLEVWEQIADEVTALLRGHGYTLRDGGDPGFPTVSRAAWCTLAEPTPQPALMRHGR